MMTFKEYIEDYGDKELKEIGNRVIEKNLANIPDEKMREETKNRLARIERESGTCSYKGILCKN